MKHLNSLFRKCVIILCLVALISINCFASGDTLKYTETFEKSLSVDGAASESYAKKLKELFDQETDSFITALNQESDEILSKVLLFLISETKTAELDGLVNHFVPYKDNPQYDRLLSVFYTHFNERLSYEESKVSELPEIVQGDAFDPEIIKKFIDLDFKIGEGDDAYKQVIANAYLADPILFAESIRCYPNQKIDGILESISIGLKLQNQTPPIINGSTIHGDILHILNVIQEKYYAEQTVSNPTNIISQYTNIDMRSNCVPSIGTMVYTSGDLCVGSIETLEVTFTENSQTMSSRQWWIEVYQVVGNTHTRKIAKTITMPPMVTSLPYQFDLSFSSTCRFYTYVKVYSYNGGTLLTSRTGASPDIVRGEWSIRITLPTNRDYLGTLCLYDASGIQKYTTDCLGKSALNLPMSQTNGDTPTGVYTGQLGGPASDTAAYRPYKYISMTGISGKIVEYSHRSGIWIHGGRAGYSAPDDPWYPLYPTYGCIRVSNTAQQTLQSLITGFINNYFHYQTGKITII